MVASAACAGFITYFGARAKPAPSDCIIVLGCGLYGRTPSPFLMARLDEGARLYKEGYAGRVIVSGGRGPGEDITEAQAMRDYLVEKGIPARDIIEEGESTSTQTNLRFSQEKMRASGLSTAVVVSNLYHLARCSFLARRLGLNATFSGVQLPQYPQVEMAGFLREIPAVLYSLVYWRST